MSADGRDYEATNVTVAFDDGSNSGDTSCTDIRIFDNRAFQKTRIFSVHVALFERGPLALDFHRQYALVHIFNIDSEFYECCY